MSLVIKNLNEYEKLEGISLISYGASGTGKTGFAGTAGSRTFYIDLGHSSVTLKSPGFLARNKDYNPILAEISEASIDGKGVPDKATGFDTLVSTMNLALTKEYIDRWDTMVIDEMTALSRFAMFKGLEINQNLRKSKSREESQANKSLVIVVQDFGQEMNLIEGFITEAVEVICKKAKKNLILVAHQRLIYGKAPSIGDEAPLLKVMPGFTGKTFPDTIVGLVDWVLYHECVGGGDKPIYRVRTSGDEKLIAKVRHDGVFKTLESNPNFLDMLQRVKDAYGKKP